MVKVKSNEPILVFYDTLVCINPVATKKRNLETMKVKLSNLMYLAIIHAFVFAHNIISINTYTTILICAFLILAFSVKRVSIYVIPLICHNNEYRATCHFCRYSLIGVYDPEIHSHSQPMNFLMCSFANQSSFRPGLSLSNISLCSSKYSDTMNICCNT
jgi:hypothetical protein